MVHGATEDFPSWFYVSGSVFCIRANVYWFFEQILSTRISLYIWLSFGWGGIVVSSRRPRWSMTISSFHSSTIFLVRLLTSPGRCRYTTWSSRCYLLWLSVSLISSSLHESWTDTLSCISSVRRTSSSLAKPFGCGSLMLYIIPS